MFLGFHPSLTNVECQMQQLNNQLGYDNTNPTFGLYRWRLKLEEVSTNTIVLHSARADQEKIENQLLNLKPNVIGENVEFISY